MLMAYHVLFSSEPVDILRGHYHKDNRSVMLPSKSKTNAKIKSFTLPPHFSENRHCFLPSPFQFIGYQFCFQTSLSVLDLVEYRMLAA